MSPEVSVPAERALVGGAETDENRAETKKAPDTTSAVCDVYKSGSVELSQPRVEAVSQPVAEEVQRHYNQEDCKAWEE